MRASNEKLVKEYMSTLLEIERVKKFFNIESLRRKEYQDKLESTVREKIKNGTATGLDHMMLCIKLDVFFDTPNTELDYLIKKVQSLSVLLFGENRAFPTMSDFIKKAQKRIKKLIKYILGKPNYCNQTVEDKRPLIAQFRKLLIKVNSDDVDNSITQIKNIINRVLNFHNKQNGYVIRYKKSNYQHLVMQ